MNFWRDPRALSDDWCPPSLRGRNDILQELGRSLTATSTSSPRAGLVLWGSRGVGTSAVARQLVRTVEEHWRRTDARRPPLLLRADVATERTPSRVVSALFRGIDERFRGAGCPTELLVTLLIRRLRTLGRPTVLWIDQVRATSCGLPRLLGPLLAPGRFLPEGDHDLPPYVVILSGEVDPLEDAEGIGGPLGPGVRREHLLAISAGDVLSAVEQRARLAFDTLPDPLALAAVRDLLLTKGWGLALAGPTLRESGRRAEARGARRLEMLDVAPPADPVEPRRNSRALDTCILEALREASGTDEPEGLALPELRRRLEQRCRTEGLAPPSGSRLWRHTTRLERSGAFQREVRLGGTGGSSVRFRLSPVLPPATLPGGPSPPVEPMEDPSPLAPKGPRGPGPIHDGRPRDLPPRQEGSPMRLGAAAVPVARRVGGRAGLSTRRGGPTAGGSPRGMPDARPPREDLREGPTPSPGPPSAPSP